MTPNLLDGDRGLAALAVAGLSPNLRDVGSGLVVRGVASKAAALRADTELSRLRKIEEAARGVVASVSEDGSYIPHAPRHFDAIDALRAALGDQP
jgi:hypothetical protein